MTQNQSSWWIKYSDYQIQKDENGTEYLIPAEHAIPMAYDVMAALEKNVEELVAIAHEDEEKREILFAKRFGLLGVNMEQEETLVVDEKFSQSVVFLSTGREKRYAAVLKPGYREKSARISAWLDWIVVLFNRSQNKKGNWRLEKEPFAALTLQTILESSYKNMLSEEKLHVCAVCKRVFYTDDTERKTCGEICQQSYQDIQHYRWLKEHFQGHLIAGG